MRYGGSFRSSLQPPPPPAGCWLGRCCSRQETPEANDNISPTIRRGGSADATFNDRSYRAKRKNTASMVWNDYLFARESIAPFLIASRTASQFESAAAQDRNDLVRGKPRRPAFTQPSPQPAWHPAASRVRTVQGKAGLPPRC